MKKMLLTIITTILIILTTLLLLIYKHRFFLPYNSMGNFFDEDSAAVYHQHSVLVYGFMALFFFVLTTIFVVLTIKNYKIISRKR